MMMPATWKKTFNPIQIPGKGIFGAKTWFFFKKMLEMGIFFLKFPVVIVGYI